MFNFGDKRIMYIFMAMFILSGLRNVNIESLLFSLPGILIAITFHEFAHAFAADKLGDDTPRRQDRLNLNPLSHLDPVGTVLLLFAGFGWGKPVQINPRNFDRKVSMSKGEAIVSLAGPLMNFILALVFLIICNIVVKFNLLSGLDQDVAINTIKILYLISAINVGLGVFNLIPLPPLDGSKILMHFLPYNAKQWFQNNEMIFYYIFMILFVTGLSTYIILPIMNGVFTLFEWLISLIFNLF